MELTFELTGTDEETPALLSGGGGGYLLLIHSNGSAATRLQHQIMVGGVWITDRTQIKYTDSFARFYNVPNVKIRFVVVAGPRPLKISTIGLRLVEGG